MPMQMAGDYPQETTSETEKERGALNTQTMQIDVSLPGGWEKG